MCAGLCIRSLRKRLCPHELRNLVGQDSHRGKTAFRLPEKNHLTQSLCPCFEGSTQKPPQNLEGSVPIATSVSSEGSVPRVRLIAGGLAKGDDPMLATDCLSNGVAKVYLIGHCADVFEKAWKDIVHGEICGTLEAAVEKARLESHEGDCVILSPGTASFDQFKSYGERGDRFAAFARITHSD